MRDIMLKNLKEYEDINGSQIIWRYMSLEKFESLLIEQSLYFSNDRQIGEKQEGAKTDAELKAMFNIDFSKVPPEEFRCHAFKSTCLRTRRSPAKHFIQSWQ